MLAGTHTGLVEIADSGRTTRVGVSDDDFMGLTGAPGTDRLFASGHPGASSSAPNPLGLIDSTDGGRTWIPKSLTGEVDFHALATDGELLVGFDGVTGLLISTDGGSSWTAGAPMAAAALAVTEAGVWATTTAGLQHSTDAGLTFTVVPDAPPLALLSAAPDGSLWGIDTTGTAWRSRTGQAWEPARGGRAGRGSARRRLRHRLRRDRPDALSAELTPEEHWSGSCGTAEESSGDHAVQRGPLRFRCVRQRSAATAAPRLRPEWTQFLFRSVSDRVAGVRDRTRRVGCP